MFLFILFLNFFFMEFEKKSECVFAYDPFRRMQKMKFKKCLGRELVHFLDTFLTQSIFFSLNLLGQIVLFILTFFCMKSENLIQKR